MIVVDPEDQWLLDTYTWGVTGEGYPRTTLPGKPQKHVLLHHCIVGRPIDGSDIDHIDRNKLNNSRSNLRYASRSQNQLNSTRSEEAPNIYTTGYSTWRVIIHRRKKRYDLGTFPTIAEAEEARDIWLINFQVGGQDDAAD